MSPTARNEPERNAVPLHRREQHARLQAVDNPPRVVKNHDKAIGATRPFPDWTPPVACRMITFRLAAMKSIISILTALQGPSRARINFRVLGRLLVGLCVMVTVYAVAFHALMMYEGRDFSWLTGFYWTFTVMTTLGFGDITFETDMGKAFSMLVMVSGVFYLLVLLPFTFIEFFYVPWLRGREAARAPRELPPDTRGHVILTRYDPMVDILLEMLHDQGLRGWVLCPTYGEALELYERGVPAVTGDPGDPATWEKMRASRAALLVANGTDMANTNLVFTARGLTEELPIVATVATDAARDALELAGATHLIRPEQMMAAALARRVLGTDASAHVIGELGDLVVAEACVADTPLAGQSLAASQLRSRTGVTVVGTWDRGSLVPVTPDTVIQRHSVLLLAGSKEQVDNYSEAFGHHPVAQNKVIIIGGGNVGQSTARLLDERGIDWRLIERQQRRLGNHPRAVLGDATEFDTLVKAGLQDAATVIITSHDDETNLFLTILCRRLRRRLQVITRCTDHAYVDKLHRAGADLVLSYASMMANSIFNFMSPDDTLLLAEGVNLFPSEVPPAWAGLSLGATRVREQTGCSILAVETPQGRAINPPPDLVLPAGGKLVLIGSLKAKARFAATCFKNRQSRDGIDTRRFKRIFG